jgi:hypothetical protein
MVLLLLSNMVDTIQVTEVPLLPLRTTISKCLTLKLINNSE